jgi:hypothetical protein
MFRHQPAQVLLADGVRCIIDPPGEPKRHPRAVPDSLLPRRSHGFPLGNQPGDHQERDFRRERHWPKSIEITPEPLTRTDLVERRSRQAHEELFIIGILEEHSATLAEAYRYSCRSRTPIRRA